jgi:hypothetical protein
MKKTKERGMLREYEVVAAYKNLGSIRIFMELPSHTKRRKTRGHTLLFFNL